MSKLVNNCVTSSKYDLQFIRSLCQEFYLEPVFSVSGVRHSSDTAVGVYEGVLTFDDVAVTRLGVRLLIARHGIADSVVV